jgi:hypothetical protein
MLLSNEIEFIFWQKVARLRLLQTALVNAWSSAGDQSLAPIVAVGGPAVSDAVRDSLDKFIADKLAKWESGLSGGRGRKLAGGEREEEVVPEDEGEERPPPKRKMLAARNWRALKTESLSPPTRSASSAPGSTPLEKFSQSVIVRPLSAVEYFGVMVIVNYAGGFLDVFVVLDCRKSCSLTHNHSGFLAS